MNARQSFAAGAALGFLARLVLPRGTAYSYVGQVALVTGASRGLGYILARRLAADGARLVICARDEAELERAREKLSSSGAEVLAFPCDVSDQLNVQRLVDTVLERFGRIDILINNAGVIQAGPLESTTLEDFQESMNIMFWGVLHPTLAVLPSMQQRRSGRIINITSIGGKISAPHILPYACAKFAAVGLSQGLRAELAKDNISVNTIAPGLMRTGSHLNAYFKGNEAAEFGWFAPAASLPLISMDAERAAAQILRATARGDAEKVLGAQAALAARIHGLFPGITADVLGWVNTHILPRSSVKGRSRGMVIERRVNSRVLDAVTRLGRKAAVRNLQFPGPTGAAGAEQGEVPADNTPS